jgi:hypothetical protein
MLPACFETSDPNLSGASLAVLLCLAVIGVVLGLIFKWW